MKKHLSLSLILISILFSLLLNGCDFEDAKKEFLSIFIKEESLNNQVTITPELLNQYKGLSSALISLDEKFIDELEKATPTDRQEILKNMRIAQEALVQKYQFKNMSEYLWIDNVALKDPANWAIAKQAGIHVIMNK